MTGIIKIDLPDDFTKGDCAKLKRKCLLTEFCEAQGIPMDNCPLEIQYEHISCGRCKHNSECYEASGSDTCRFEPIGE